MYCLGMTQFSYFIFQRVVDPQNDEISALSANRSLCFSGGCIKTVILPCHVAGKRYCANALTTERKIWQTKQMRVVTGAFMASGGSTADRGVTP